MCLPFYGEERVTGNACGTTLVTRWFGWRDKPFLSEVKVVPLQCNSDEAQVVIPGGLKLRQTSVIS